MVLNLNSLSKNSLILMIGSGINQFLILLVGIFSARYLGPLDYGIISLAASLNVIFIFFIVLGLHHYVIREIARDNSTVSYFYSGLIWLKILLFIPLLIFVFLFMTLLGYNKLIVFVTTITTGSFVLNSFVYGFYAIIQAHNDMKYISVGYIITGVLTFIGITFSILLKTDIYAFVFIPLIVNAVIFLSSLIFINLRYNLKIENIYMIKEFIKIHLHKAIPFGITGLFVTFYIWSGSFWISFFHGEDLVGYYNVAFRIIFATFIVSQGVNMTAYPALSSLVFQDKLATKRLFQNQIKILGFLSLLISIFIFIFSDLLIHILLGGQYTKSIVILQILVLIIPFVFIRSSFERLLEVTGNQINVMISYALGSFINLLLNLTLIYCFAIIGAAIALVLTDFIIFLTILYFSKKIHLEGVKSIS